MVERGGKKSPAIKGDERIFASFFLSGEGFAIDLGLVKEVAAYKELLPLTGMPGHVEGVIELYGVRIPVLNLAKRISIEPSCEEGGGGGCGDARGIIVVNIEGRILGLTVDTEPEMEVFSTCEPLKPLKAKESFSEYIVGRAENGDVSFHILDLSSLLSDTDKAALFGVAEGEG